MRKRSILLVLAAAVLAATALLRFGVLVEPGRQVVGVALNGMKVGRLGRLRIEGLSGDIWRDVSAHRVVISDSQGIWLEARQVRLVWRADALTRRRFLADLISADQIRIVRRPVLSAPMAPSALPISIDLRRIRARLVLDPAFSYRRGVYGVGARLDLERAGGGASGLLVATSALHAGDHLRANFNLPRGGKMRAAADAEEASGGALAGALGLATDQPFDLKGELNGSLSQGAFTLRAVSGPATPLAAQGAWTAQGGQAWGRLSLTASRLTRGLAERLGPEAAFKVTGEKAARGLYDLAAEARADNLTVTVRGPGDIGARRTGPTGLNLIATTPDLSRVIGRGPDLGAGRVAGRLTGSPKDWTFVGVSSAADLSTAGYNLRRAGGALAIRVRNRILTLKAQAKGEGGAGHGLAAALLGAGPNLVVEASRRSDGRLLLERLEATGAGLEIKATGERGLLGAMTFKGQAAVSRLSAWRPGAAGGLKASWSARQEAAGKPWAFTADGRGERLATGLAELDRLLGPAPRLTLRAGLAAGALSVSQGDLAGAAVKASTSGSVRADGGLKFALNWSAVGPFRAGAVEITGQARGTGTLSGTVAAPRADLIADVDAVDLPRLPLTQAHLILSFQSRPDGTNGTVSLTADSGYGPARARSAFAFREGGVDLAGLDADAGGLKARGDIALRRAGASAADLTLDLGKGAFLEAGHISGRVKIADSASGPQADLTLRAENALLPGARLAVASGRITAQGPLARLPFSLEAAGVASGGRWAVRGDGRYVDLRPGAQIVFQGQGRLGRRTLSTAEPAEFRLVGADRTARLRLASPEGGRVSFDARALGDEAEVHADIRSLGLELFDEDLTGKVDAVLDLRGRGDRLGGTLEGRLEGARSRGSDVKLGLDGDIKARLGSGAITLVANAGNSQGLKAQANLVLPAESSARPFRVAINRQRPLSGRFSAEGEIKPLWDVLMSGERSLAGMVRTQGVLGGALADPNATGQATLTGGRFEDGASGLVLRDVSLSAAFADNAIDVTQASGADGHGGEVTGSGRISLAREGASSFRLNLKNFRLIDNEQATASASGPGTIDRNAAGAVRITANLTLDRADVAARTPTPSGVVRMEVIERNKPADLGMALAAPRRAGTGVALDVTLKAPRRVFLRGNGLDAELSLDAHVGGTTSSPVLQGAARIVRGDYDFAGKRFEFDEHGVVYLATSPSNIRLDLTATREDPTLTAVVRIRGTAAKPDVTLSSTPVLPNDEVLSQVLFGVSASQLSPLEAAQLASALTSLAGGGGFDVVGGLRNLAGLDRLALGGGGASGVTVSGGKYLTDDVYLELTGGGRDGASAQVEWRVSRTLSLISKLAGQGDAKLAVRWRKDY